MDNQISTVQATPEPLSDNDSWGTFISVATHQLRSPLTTMSWTLDLLLKNLETDQPDQVKHKLEVIFQSTHHLIELVNDISVVAHLNQNSLNEEKTPTSLPVLLQSSIDELKARADAKSVIITLTIANPELTQRHYLVDPKWFALCFQKIIANAVRYSNPNGQVQITVSESNGQVWIAVADQGIGISETDQAHVFEKFFKGQNVYNESEADNGLGLFISRSIAQRLGGNITIASQENQGTTVTVCLPLEVTT